MARKMSRADLANVEGYDRALAEEAEPHRPQVPLGDRDDEPWTDWPKIGVIGVVQMLLRGGKP